MLKIPGCCCFSLETGAKIIGLFVTIFTALNLIILVTNDLSKEPCVFNAQRQLLGIDYEYERCKIDEIGYPKKYGYNIIASLIYFFLHILLLIGVYTRNHEILLAVIKADLCAVAVSFVVLSLLLSWNGVVIAIVMNSLILYFILVLYSLYDKIKSEKSCPNIINDV